MNGADDVRSYMDRQPDALQKLRGARQTQLIGYDGRCATGCRRTSAMGRWGSPLRNGRATRRSQSSTSRCSMRTDRSSSASPSARDAFATRRPRPSLATRERPPQRDRGEPRRALLTPCAEGRAGVVSRRQALPNRPDRAVPTSCRSRRELRVPLLSRAERRRDPSWPPSRSRAPLQLCGPRAATAARRVNR
jgi:hypothetical protein